MIEEKIFAIDGIDYIVSSDGKIYSTKNIGRGKYHKEISQRDNSDGYKTITVGKNDRRRTMSVHRLVALAFIPNPDGLPEVDHIDNNRKNNNASNLQWITSLENKRKTPFEARSKTHKGELNGRAMLKESDVIEIRRLYEINVTCAEIARIYGRGWSTSNNIIMRNTWKGI